MHRLDLQWIPGECTGRTTSSERMHRPYDMFRENVQALQVPKECTGRTVSSERMNRPYGKFRENAQALQQVPGECTGRTTSSGRMHKMLRNYMGTRAPKLPRELILKVSSSVCINATRGPRKLGFLVLCESVFNRVNPAFTAEGSGGSSRVFRFTLLFFYLFFSYWSIVR